MNKLRRFLRREDGAATVELALFFPILIWPFMMAAETGFLQMRQAMLERAMDIVVRDLRMGREELSSTGAVKTAVCERIAIMPHCERDLLLEMLPVTVTGFQPPSDPPRCVDRSEEVAPVTTFTRGSGNDLMLMRFCILHDPIFPGIGLGKQLDNDGAGHAMIARTFFVNEPQ